MNDKKLTIILFPDVVSAYRSLLKEKEALQQSLNAIQQETQGANALQGEESDQVGNETEDSKQIAALVSSITTLTEGKSQMEALFQANNKKLREEKEAAEKKRDELQDAVAKFEIEVEDWKSKLIKERHERDKEQADHGEMMKELQSLMSSERQQRLQLEEVLNDHKKRASADGGINIEKYEKRMERLQNELEIARRKLDLAEKKNKEPPSELFKLQDEIRNLQVEHQTAIEQERQRAEMVEDRAKKQALLQEERVVNLETRLAELSASVGSYDRLRQQDQSEINKLKEHLATVNLEKNVPDNRSEGYNITEKEEKRQYEEKVPEVSRYHEFVIF